jgi:polysaccharide deacetylase 2 family uncharacterized protein YibQ
LSKSNSLSATRPRIGFHRAPCLLAGLSGTILLLIAGCGKKQLSKAEVRGITAEIVSAAQKSTLHKSEITIRPEVQSARGNETVELVVDDIFVSPTDTSQLSELRQSISGIAKQHKLSVAEASSGGVVRIDLAFEGYRTHTIHIVMPLNAKPRPPATKGAKSPRLAIIVDDMGYDRAAADRLLALPFPLTVSVLPHLPLSTEVAEEAYRRGDEVLLHLPMESESSEVKHEESELRIGMNAKQVDSAVAGMLETVPHAIGVNNHQGSRATADPPLMQALMPALRQRGLFFIDSRTTPATIAYDVAEGSGVRAASRRVFLDDTPTREAILAQLKLAEQDAVQNGSAIAIGHPHPATIAALTEEVPRLEARGIRLVFASAVVH